MSIGITLAGVSCIIFIIVNIYLVITLWLRQAATRRDTPQHSFPRREGVTTGNVSCKVPYPNLTLLNSGMPYGQTPRLSINQSINKYLNSEKTQTTARL